MTKYVLHTLTVPEDAQTRLSTGTQRNISGSGVLAGEAPAVEAVSIEPGERPLAGTFRGKRAAMLAQRFEELFDAPDVSSVAFYGASTATQADGYYSLRNIDVAPTDPRDDRFQEFSGVLIKQGTRQSHWRTVETTPVQLTNDFGTDTTGYISVPATATKLTWFDPSDKSRESVSLVETRNAEHGDVEIYDAQTPSITDPHLLYELPYSDEGKVDCRVYDDRGNSSKTDGNGDLQWQTVFRPTHDFEGQAVVSNGLRRLYFDDANNSLTAESWNNSTSSWDSTSLGSSDWQLWDTDLTRIGLATVWGQITFEDTSGGTLFRLNMRLHRGYNDPQWFVPPDESTNSGTTPSGLQTLLNPIANGSEVNPQPVKTVTERKEARL